MLKNEWTASFCISYMFFRYDARESQSQFVCEMLRQSTSESSMTQPKPVTDRIVSISDQVFNV